MKMTLRALRINAGLKQSETAEKIGVYIGTLRNYEKGKTYPDQPIIEKLCKLYNCEYDDIDFLTNN